MRATQPPRDLGCAVLTVCHGCEGDGAVAVRSAATLDGEGVLAYRQRSCPVCDGREWLAGLVPPL